MKNTRTRTRFSRRQSLRLMAAGIGSTLLVACGEATTSTTAVRTSAPVASATLPVDMFVPTSTVVSVPTATATSAASPTNTQPTSSPAPTRTSGVLQPATIRVAGFEDEVTPELIAAFQALYPTIEIIVQPKVQPGPVIPLIESPDIIFLDSEELAFQLLQNTLLDITAYVRASPLAHEDDFFPAPLAPFRVDDRLYGLPRSWYPGLNLFVAQPAFEDAGIPLPSETTPLTYAQIATFVRDLTSHERLGYGVENRLPLYQLQAALLEKGQSLYTPDLSRVLLTSNPIATAMLTSFYELAQQGFSLPPDTLGSSSSFRAFADGRLAIWQTSYGYIDWFPRPDAEHALETDQIRFLPAPSWGGKMAINLPVFEGDYVILKETKYPDAAWLFYAYFMVGPPAVERAKRGKGVPALKALYGDMPQTTTLQQQAAAVLQQELQRGAADYSLQLNPYCSTLNFNAIWERHLEQALKAGISPDRLIREFEDEINAMITRFRKEGLVR